MPVTVTWKQALAWRMRRHLLDPVGRPSVADVVRRLCGVQAQVASTAELAVRVRRTRSHAGEVTSALSDGRLIKTWAMRGTLHLLTPDDGGAYLSLIAAGRPWARPSWQKHFGMSPDEIERLRLAVRAELEKEGVMTREELTAAVTARRGLRHIGEALGSGWGTLLKPIAWQGDLCHGPSRGNRVTFTIPESASPRWSGLPPPAEAAPRAIAAYLGSHGPATVGAFGAWLAGGFFGVRTLRGWFEDLGDRLTEVDVEGASAYVRAEDTDELASTEPTSVVRLLPGFDQYVLAPGTGDPNVVPTARRSEVSRQSGWISPVVVAAGVVSGTWEVDGDIVRIAWFEGAGRTPRKALEAEVARLASILDADLRAEISRS
jgi:hypothetical protein